MTHKQILGERGGIRPVARALGHLNHTTVQGWWERKNIPEAHLEAVLALPVVEQPSEIAA